MEFLTKPVRLAPKNAIYPGMFDMAKGWFILMELLVHSLLVSYPIFSWGGTGGMKRKLFFYCFKLIGCGLIPMLFLSCGYGWRKKKMDKAIKSQLSVLGKPYLIVTILICVMCVLGTPVTGETVKAVLMREGLPFLLAMSPGEVTFLGIYMYYIGSVWCIVAYFFASILLNAVLHEKESWIQLFLVVLMACVGIALKNKILPFCFQQTMICTGYMYIGWLMKKKDFFSREVPLYVVLLGAAAFLGLTYYCELEVSHNIWKHGMLDVLYGLLAGTVGLIAALNLNFLRGKLTEFIRWCGRNAFQICCVHTVILVSPQPFLGLFFLPVYFADGNKFLMAMAAFGVNFVWDLGIVYLMKKIQVIRAQRELKKGSTADV